MWNTPPSPPAPDQAPSPASALMEGGLQLGVPLSPHTVARLVLYLQELVRWNAKANLTRLAGPAWAVLPADDPCLEAGTGLSRSPPVAGPPWHGAAFSSQSPGGRPAWVPARPASILHASLHERSSHPDPPRSLPAKLIETSVILSPRAESAGLRRRFDPLQLEWVVPSWAPRRARAPTGESAGLRRRKAPRDGAARRQDPLHEQRVPRLRWAMKGQDPHKEQRVPRRW